MCKFLSAIVSRDEIYHRDEIDSHELLERSLGMTATARKEREFVRVEFSPDADNDLADISKYKLRVDQETTPDWWAERSNYVEEYLREVVKKKIITGYRDLILGGCWIVANGAKVSTVVQSRIIAVCAGGTVQEVCAGGMVQKVWAGGMVQKVCAGGTVQKVCAGGTVQEVWAGGTVQKVCYGGIIVRDLRAGK